MHTYHIPQVEPPKAVDHTNLADAMNLIACLLMVRVSIVCARVCVPGGECEVNAEAGGVG